MVTASAPQWTETEKQAAFLSRTEFEVLFGGAKYGAKTDALLMWLILRAQTYPNSRHLFIRRQLSEIVKQGAAWDRIQQLLGPRVLYNKTEHTVRFPNSSVLEFGHCNDEADKLQYQGAQYDSIGFDQIEQFQEGMYSYILGACRHSRPADPPKDDRGIPIVPRVRCTGNPGDIGHAWVKARFIDIAPPAEPYTYEDVIETPKGTVRVTRQRVFIPSFIWDNPYASENYMAQLNAMPEPYRTAYLYGRWDIFVGQAFMDFEPMKDGKPYHVIPTEDINPQWRRAEGHDWGFSAMCYTCWGAVDPDGGIIIYRELAGRGWQTDEIAHMILEHRGADRVGVTWCDPSLFRPGAARAYMSTDQLQALQEKGATANLISDQYRVAGLHSCQPSNNDRLAGKQRIHELLKPRRDGRPLLRIMANCPILIETLSQIQIDPKRSEDVITVYPPDAVLRDDPYDGLRYLTMGLRSIEKAVTPADPVSTGWSWYA